VIVRTVSHLFAFGSADLRAVADIKQKRN
jgi:hypothetical protein